MSSAQVKIRQQDRSAIVPSLDGISIGTVIDSDWGPDEPSLVTSITQLEDRYGKPNNKKGSSWNGAELLLSESNSVWINRAKTDDGKHSAALVKFGITKPDPNVMPLPDAMPEVIVEAIPGGLTKAEIASYNDWPKVAADQEGYDTENIVAEDVNDSTTVEVSKLDFLDSEGNLHVFEAGGHVVFDVLVDQASLVYEIDSAENVDKLLNSVLMDIALIGDRGDEVFRESGGIYVSFPVPVYLEEDAAGTLELLVTDNDLILDGELLSMQAGTTPVVTATVISKQNTVTQVPTLVLKNKVTIPDGSPISTVTQLSMIEVVAFLATGKYIGEYGDNFKIGIQASSAYPDEAFVVEVFVNGELKEQHEVTRAPKVDGFGQQMFLEEVINQRSAHINVRNNDFADPLSIPDVTDYNVWRQSEYDIFLNSTTSTIETINIGDTEIKLTAATFLIGDRIRFGGGDINIAEYRVVSSSVDGTGNPIIGIDRGFLGTQPKDTAIFVFDGTLSDPAAGIWLGKQYFKYCVEDGYLTGYTIGDTQLRPPCSAIEQSESLYEGIVLDAGTNNTGGGADGLPVDMSDVIESFRELNNTEKYQIQVYCDNGWSWPDVAIELDNISKNNNRSHSFLSVSQYSELTPNSIQPIIDYRNNSNLNSEYSSMFTGWIKVTDVYNKTRVWVAPSVFGVNAQSFVTRNYQIFTPAAGWIYGRLNGLEVSKVFTLGERDLLVNAQLNPIRKRDGYGLAIWGNETLYAKPSPLQLRSVAMLLIVLKYGLENYLDFELFQFNNQETWRRATSAIDIFIRDELYDKGGLYDYSVHIEDVITPTDIDNRIMPVSVLIQPTIDIQTIPVTIGIFNRSLELTI